MSLAIPVVILRFHGEEVDRFWPIDLQHGRAFIAWYNGCKKAEGARGESTPKAEMGQAARYPPPWRAWTDNCSTENRCLKFRGVGWRTTVKHTRPDEAPYLPQPTPDDASLSLLG